MEAGEGKFITQAIMESAEEKSIPRQSMIMRLSKGLVRACEMRCVLNMTVVYDRTPMKAIE
jgi:hypothetical protein